jgi:hypothetical protein
MKPIISQIGNLAAKKKAHSLRARDSVRRASDFVQIAIGLTTPQPSLRGRFVGNSYLGLLQDRPRSAKNEEVAVGPAARGEY